MPETITSGAWQTAEYMEDYRVERLSDTLVERATWLEGAPELHIAGSWVNPPGAIWFRFWLVPMDRIVEKYFDESGNLLGMRVPVCTPMDINENAVEVIDLDLALWLSPEEQVMVINEERFDAAVANGDVTPVEAEHAEQTIREFTLSVAAQEFPPALIRNFELDTGTEP